MIIGKFGSRGDREGVGSKLTEICVPQARSKKRGTRFCFPLFSPFPPPFFFPLFFLFLLKEGTSKNSENSYSYLYSDIFLAEITQANPVSSMLHAGECCNFGVVPLLPGRHLDTDLDMYIFTD